MKEASALTIAGINAAILAISVATLGIVVAMLGDKRLSVFQEILDDQPLDDQPKVLFSSYTCSRTPMYARGTEPGTDDTGKISRSKELIEAITRATFHEEPCPPGVTCPTLSQLGTDIVRDLSTLVLTYPFTLGSEGDAKSIERLLAWQSNICSLAPSLNVLDSYRGHILRKVAAAQSDLTIAR